MTTITIGAVADILDRHTPVHRYRPPGPVCIKDRVACSWFDHARLMVLDAIGNIPFGVQVRARYLSLSDWDALAHQSGYRIAATSSGGYRSGTIARVFPNRLEAAFRLDPA